MFRHLAVNLSRVGMFAPIKTREAKPCGSRELILIRHHPGSASRFGYSEVLEDRIGPSVAVVVPVYMRIRLNIARAEHERDTIPTSCGNGEAISSEAGGRNETLWSTASCNFYLSYNGKS